MFPNWLICQQTTITEMKQVSAVKNTVKLLLQATNSGRTQVWVEPNDGIFFLSKRKLGRFFVTEYTIKATVVEIADS